MHATVRSNTNKADTGESSLTRQGSLRRVIPSELNKENLFGRQNEDLNKFYKKFHQEYIILAEYKMLQSENIQGVYVIPSKESSFVWFGVIFVRSGLYEDGIFRFNINLPENFPEGAHPNVIFHSEISHPVIHPDTNELHLMHGFPTWKKGEQHIWQVLKYVQWIFYNFEASIAHGINNEAINLYKNNPDVFNEKVQTIVKLSQERIYDAPSIEDPHYITFERYNTQVHDPVRKMMLAPPNEEYLGKKGHSWVAPGSFKPLSKLPSPDSDSSES